jgi:hypothetical protein
VLYIDEDLQKPFITYEDNFLVWYERWLDEIINGYKIFWFGMNIGGDDSELINKFNNSSDEVYKRKAILGLHKLPVLQQSTIDFLEFHCKNGTGSIKNDALGVLSTHNFAKAAPFLRDMLKNGDAGTQLVALQCINGADKNIEELIDEVKPLLSMVNSEENFRSISRILEKSNQHDIELYIPFFLSP